jgi:translocation and assembly module TamA
MTNRLNHLLHWLLLPVLLCTSVAYSSDLVEFNATVAGIHSDMLENANQRLNIERDSFGKQLSDKAAETLYNKGPEIIKQAIQPFGYFNPTIHASLKKTDNTWFAKYKVKQGPPLLIQRIQIDVTGPGKDNLALQHLKSHPPIAPGKRFTTERYEWIKKVLFNTAHNQGYTNAQMIKHETQIDIKNNTAVIIFSLDTGPRYYFGSFSFSEEKYSIDFLKKFVPFKKGQPYSPKKLQTLQTSLSNTKFFSSVNVTPDNARTQKNTVPVTIDTKAVPSQIYNIGAGYGTNTGIRTSMNVHLNRLTDTGQHMIMGLSVSEVNTALLAKYYIPGPDPIRNQYSVAALIQEFNPSGGKAFSRGVSPGYTTNLSHNITVNSTLNYLHERYSIDSDPYETADMMYPELTVSKSESNEVINPSNGYLIALKLRTAYLFTPTTFNQEELTGKWVHNLGNNALIMLRGNLGTTSAHPYDKLPMTLRYFAGGVNSVRGYSEQNMGPGKYLKVASVEVQQRLYQEFYGALYFDAGNATDNFHDSLKKGQGTGIVWHSPIGPIALYVTQAISSHDKPLRIDISIGTGL